MVKRQVFYSFHYELDNWRASQVRNMGIIEGNRPATDNDWEQVKKGGETAIKRWIDQQMQYRSCTVVLVGTNTANREWINYEIRKSWDNNMGVVGIHIHGLENRLGYRAPKGQNPFNYLFFQNGTKLSNFAKCYDPLGRSGKEVYAWISKYLSAAVEEAINIRRQHPR